MGPMSSFEIDISPEMSFRNTEYKDLCTCRFASKLIIAKFVFAPTLESVRVAFASVDKGKFSGFDRFKDSSSYPSSDLNMKV